MANLQPRRDGTVSRPEFLRNAVGLQYKTGNVVLDVTKLTPGETVHGGTAVHYNATTQMYEPVLGGATPTPATMVGAVLTRDSAKVYAGQNPMVGALTACNAIEVRCTGVTTAFKDAVKGRIVFDV